MPGRAALTIYVAAPWILWPLSFVVFRDHFIWAMAASTGLIGMATLLLGVAENLGPRRRWPLAAVAYTALLYTAFAAGNLLAEALGMGQGVEEVYRMVGRDPILAAPLAWIGFWEEVYWRAGLQEGIVSGRLRLPWPLASIPYALVHVSTGNPVLVAAALVVGLTLGHEAHRYGAAVSAASHVAWLYLVLLAAPLR